MTEAAAPLFRPITRAIRSPDSQQIEGRYTIHNDHTMLMLMVAAAAAAARQDLKLYSAFTAESGPIDTIGHYVDDRIDFVNQPTYRGFSLRFRPR